MPRAFSAQFVSPLGDPPCRCTRQVRQPPHPGAFSHSSTSLLTLLPLLESYLLICFSVLFSAMEDAYIPTKELGAATAITIHACMMGIPLCFSPVECCGRLVVEQAPLRVFFPGAFLHFFQPREECSFIPFIILLVIPRC